MNQNSHTLRLHDFLVGGEGWGSKAGIVARRKLQQRLDNRASAELVRLSMSGVRKIDVTFASEAICELIKEHRDKRAICLVDVGDEDVRANLVSAAQRSGVPLTLWHAGAVEVAGRPLGPAMRKALALVLGRPQLRSADLAAEHGLGASAASNLLRQLAQGGYVLRQPSTAASGGIEYAYSRIG